MKSDLIRTSQRETRECVCIPRNKDMLANRGTQCAMCTARETREKERVFTEREQLQPPQRERHSRAREREMRPAKNDVDAHQICEITAAQSINRKVVERRGRTIILALRTSSIAATYAYMASSGKRRVLGEKRKQSREFKRGARRPEPIDALLPKLSRANFKDCKRIAHSVLYYFSRIRGMWNSWISRLFSDRMKNHEWSISCPRRRGSNAYLRKELNYA
ncbi:unnamed protein product, partial [Trichogramma brassicae]